MLPVEIVWTKAVSELKMTITEKKKHEFDYVDTNHLELWKVSDTYDWMLMI